MVWCLYCSQSPSKLVFQMLCCRNLRPLFIYFMGSCSLGLLITLSFDPRSQDFHPDFQKLPGFGGRDNGIAVIPQLLPMLKMWLLCPGKTIEFCGIKLSWIP